MKVLVVEDEERVADFVQRGLRGEGWTVTVVADGNSALSACEGDEFDVIVLDLMLPGVSGQDVCRRLRARKNHTPILMLSALDQVDDRVSGLRLGADDYLTKPFDFDELIARIEALARRASSFENGDGQEHVLCYKDLRFDTRSLEVTIGTDVIDLSGKERELLKLFLCDAGRVHTRERILNAVWGISADPQTNVVDVYIGRLRKKLGEAAPIETVRGAGYRLSVR